MEITDIPSLLAIQGQMAFQDWNERQFTSEINASYAYCIVCENESKEIQGYAIFHMMGPDSELLSIAVSSNAQRTGLGTQLLQDGFSKLNFNEGDCCFLEVREGNAKARSFYEKHGFKLFGFRKKYYSDGENAALYKVGV